MDDITSSKWTEHFSTDDGLQILSFSSWQFCRRPLHLDKHSFSSKQKFDNGLLDLTSLQEKFVADIVVKRQKQNDSLIILISNTYGNWCMKTFDLAKKFSFDKRE